MQNALAIQVGVDNKTAFYLARILCEHHLMSVSLCFYFTLIYVSEKFTVSQAKIRSALLVLKPFVEPYRQRSQPHTHGQPDPSDHDEQGTPVL